MRAIRGPPVGETLHAYRIKPTITKAVTCQAKAHQQDCPNSRMHQHTRMPCTRQQAHTAAMIQDFTTAPVMQHLKSTRYHRAISPVACH